MALSMIKSPFQVALVVPLLIRSALYNLCGTRHNPYLEYRCYSMYNIPCTSIAGIAK